MSFEKQTHTDLASRMSLMSFSTSLHGSDSEQKNKERTEPEINSLNSFSSVESTSLVPDALGMTVDQALELWRQHGAPVIHLAPGVNCSDLEELLSRTDVLPEHLEAVKVSLDKVLKQRGES